FFCIRFSFTCPSPTAIYTFPYTTLFRSHRRAGLEQRRVSRRGGGPDLPGHRVDGQHVLLRVRHPRRAPAQPAADHGVARSAHRRDRKSTRLNSSHVKISYAVFCLKKKTS